MPYEDVWIAIEDDTIHGWWIPADETERFTVLENEPAHVLTQPKVMLYFCGVGNNMGDYNYLSRAAAFRQLGFSVFIFDYRGYGQSEGGFPHEEQLYADGEAVWTYLQNEREVAAKDIVIYGEVYGRGDRTELSPCSPRSQRADYAKLFYLYGRSHKKQAASQPISD